MAKVTAHSFFWKQSIAQEFSLIKRITNIRLLYFFTFGLFICFNVFAKAENTDTFKDQESDVKDAIAVSTETAEESYSEHGNSIFQIRIMNTGSKSQSTLGSGFFIGKGNLLVTNYHVVSMVVLEPDNYTAEVDIEGKTIELDVVAIDVIHDLAILSSSVKVAPLKLSNTIPARGAKLYSMGNPLDIGMTIVEGNYNGLVENRFFDRIHFSGAVNSGMSGGPTLDAKGEVVGINVASARNQVGFLVPVDKLSTLFDSVNSDSIESQSTNSDLVVSQPTNSELIQNDIGGNSLTEEITLSSQNSDENLEDDVNPFHAELATQIQRATHHMINELLKNDWPSEELGEARVVGKVHDVINCWGDSSEDDEQKITTVQKGCNSRDGFFISRRLNTGYMEYEFTYSQVEDWPVSSFYRRMSQNFALAMPGNRADKDDVDNYTCINKILSQPLPSVKLSRSGEHKLAPTKRKVSYCTRPYKKLKGIYDTFYVGLSIDKRDRVLMEHFTLSGVSKEDGERFLRQFIDQVSWK